MHFQTPIQIDWPDSGHASVNRARTFHIDQMARWLNRAGAEPRLGYVLAAGHHAVERFVDELSSHQIDIKSVRMTADQPVPQAIRGHVGDHFNSTLYLVDGLEAGDILENVAQLETLREQLLKTATWVVLLVKSPSQLSALHERAPRLMRMMMHCCLVAGDRMTDDNAVGAPASQVKQWRRLGRTRDCVFNTLLTRGEVIDYWDYTRVLHSGYGIGFSPKPNGLGARLHTFWQSDTVDCVNLTDDDALVEAALRHRPELCPQDTLSQLSDRLMGHFLPMDPVFKESNLLLLELSKVVGGTALADADSLRDALAQTGVSNDAARTKIEMVIAQLRAAQDDLDGCRQALETAMHLGESSSVQPELLFGVLETKIRFHTLIGERAQARELLDTMELKVRQHGSPFYQARLQRALGEFLVSIDPRRAYQELIGAEQVFRALGYGEWASQTLKLAHSSRR